MTCFIIWEEDARAFVAKPGPVTKYHVRDSSVWVLGLEDPRTCTRTYASRLTDAGYLASSTD